jgi:hypothetical protein
MIQQVDGSSSCGEGCRTYRRRCQSARKKIRPPAYPTGPVGPSLIQGRRRPLVPLLGGRRTSIRSTASRCHEHPYLLGGRQQRPRRNLDHRPGRSPNCSPVQVNFADYRSGVAGDGPRQLYGLPPAAIERRHKLGPPWARPIPTGPIARTLTSSSRRPLRPATFFTSTVT